MSDPNFGTRVLLLHCNGTDASTTFTDDSQTTKTVTANNGAQIDTAQSKFGGASGLFAGTDDFLSIPDHTDFRFTTVDFTIEFWVRFSNVASADLQQLICKPNDGTGATPWEIHYDPFSGHIAASIFNSSGTFLFTLEKTTTIAVNTWYHVALTRSGSTFRLFLDGVAATSQTSSASVYASTDSVLIGKYITDLEYPLEGWLDDIRLSKSRAEYTSNFTPPTAEFEGPAIPGIATETDTSLALTSPGVVTGPVGRADETDTAVSAVRRGWIADSGLPSAPSILSRLNFGRIIADSPLGSASILSNLVFGRFKADSMLGVPQMIGFTDFTPYLAVEQRQRYWMDLVTPTKVVRLPISSWQSTQQIDSQCYAACTVPACTPYLTDLYAATDFVIVRQATRNDGTRFEVEMARCPVGTLQTDEGPTNHTASLSGYFDAFPEVVAPDAQYDRTLTGVRSISVYASGVRMRCDIDWLLRPSQRAHYSTTSFIAAYINYYVTQNNASIDAYMDVGERTA